MEFPFGNTKKVVEEIKDTAHTIIKDGKIPFMIGGEHLVSLGLAKALVESNDNIRILHFDAHADLRNDYLGESLSHATVMRRIWDLVGDNRIYQFGIRSGLKEEFDWAKEHTRLNLFNFNNLRPVLKELTGVPVYVTIDLDVLDPSVFPGTGTIEPGGVFFADLIEAIKGLRELNIIGADVVELSPHYDSSGASTAVACKVIRELVLSMMAGF